MQGGFETRPYKTAPSSPQRTASPCDDTDARRGDALRRPIATGGPVERARQCLAPTNHRASRAGTEMPSPDGNRACQCERRERKAEIDPGPVSFGILRQHEQMAP